MNIPGFNAESSLGPTKGIYRGKAVFSRFGMVGISPVELAENLRPVQMDRALNMSLAAQKFQGKLLEPRSVSCTTINSGYVVYPMTVCFPFGNLGGLGGRLDWTIEASPSIPDWAPGSQSVKNFKLSEPQSAAFHGPFCHVSGGPWFAQVTTIKSCEGSDSSVLEIIGAPEPLTISWTGDIKAIPAPFREQDFSLEGPTICRCCAGLTQCPDGRCVPPGVRCEVGLP